MALPVGEHVIEGVLSGLEPKTNGWMRFSVTREGMEWPDKVDTKKEEIIRQATALMGQKVSVAVLVADSGNPNPHKPGENFLNRYLNAIGPPGTLGQTSIATPTAKSADGGSPYGGGEDPAKSLRIARQNAASHAVAMLAAGKLPPEQENMVGLVEVAEAWVAYTLLGPARFGVQAFNEEPRKPEVDELIKAAAAANPDGPPPADDDIPF